MKGSRNPLLRKGARGGVIVLLGPQGSGKGTQAKLLAKKLHLAHVEVGALLRKEASANTALGRRIQKTVNEQGKLFPFGPTMRLALAAVRRVPKRQGILFDGTPRRMEEVRFWETALPRIGRAFTHFIFLNLSHRESLRRLALRRVCSACKSVWIMGVDVRRELAPCPACGGKLVRRADDHSAAVRKRLALFAQKTSPVIRYFRRKGIVHDIDGEQSIAAVLRDIENALQKR